MVDVGVDQFFGGANDLVVPSEGGWRVDRDGIYHIGPGQIGCFGPGGNLAMNEASPVMHTSFFSRPETAEFIINTLQGKPQPQRPINPDIPLPDRRFFRRAITTTASPLTPQRPRLPAPADEKAAPLQLVSEPKRVTSRYPISEVAPESSEVFYISVLAQDPKKQVATLLATFRNARAIQKINVSRGIIKGMWDKIKHTQTGIQKYIDGDPKVRRLPSGDELIELGKRLFFILFSGNICRLYDVARAAQPDGHISLIFTSMVDWIAVMPWEFVYDPQRKNFLATSEVNFTRNVDTGVPADRMEGSPANSAFLSLLLSHLAWPTFPLMTR